jgi:hypothetical protein
MRDQGLLDGAAGNCIGISEILQHLLSEIGIQSRLIECKLLSTTQSGDQIKDFQFIGYNADHRLRDQGWVDTHVVVITETDIPQLIDLSIPHLLKGRLWLHDAVNSVDPEIVSEYRLGEQHLIYSVKKNIRLLGMHQTTLIDRIDSERRVRQQLINQRTWLWALAVFGVVNLLLNLSLFIMGHINH